MDSFVQKVLTICTRLEVLNINLNIYLTNKTLEHLLKLGPSLPLSRLSVSLNSFINDETIVQLVNSLPNLKSLNISGTMISNFKLESKGLERLYMNACEKLTEASLEYIFDHCPNLQIVEVHDLPMISSILLVELQSKFKNVDILYT